MAISLRTLQRWRRQFAGDGDGGDRRKGSARHVGLLREWMLAQIADQDKNFDQLICDGKTLRGSAAQPDSADGATRFVTQVTLYARELGVAIAQTSFDTGESHERAALKSLLSTLELEGVLIQADALHTSPAFFNSPPSRAPTCS
jgi:hypothetical protein